MTSGERAGTSGTGRRFAWRTFAGLSLFTIGACTVNALSVLDDVGAIAAWKPFVWEWSSAATTIAFLPVIYWLSQVAPPGRGRWGRFGAVHAAGAIAYSLFHVGGFVLLRKLAYANLGQMYDFGSMDRLFYEFRKDLMTYAAVTAVFMVTARLGRSAEPAIARPLQAADEPTFDIRDGARLIRAPVGEILAVRSAGNYVEFQLADGRRPLMRATLAGVAQALEPHGFLRTHRSWLVNAARVRVLEPEGSGDWRVELEGGGSAPVSRRFPEALEALRRPA